MCTKDRLDYHWNIIFKETLARSSFVFPASAKLCKISYPYVFPMRVLEFLDTSFIHLKSIFEIVIFLKKKGIIHDLRHPYPEMHGRKCTKKDLCFVWINFFSYPFLYACSLHFHSRFCYFKATTCAVTIQAWLWNQI